MVGKYGTRCRSEPTSDHCASSCLQPNWTALRSGRLGGDQYGRFCASPFIAPAWWSRCAVLWRRWRQMPKRSSNSQRILIVEDEAALLVFYRQVLEDAGFRTRATRSGPEALTAFTEFVPDLVILDLMLLGDMDGFEV